MAINLEKNQQHEVNCSFIPSEKMDPDMAVRFRDRAIYYIIHDAHKGEEEFFLVGKNIFRPEIKHPDIDQIAANKKLIAELLLGV